MENELDTKSMGQLLKDMKAELELMKASHENPEDLDEFYKLYKRYLVEKEKKIDWKTVEPPGGKLINYGDLPECKDPKGLLSKLAVLKLNGGLGTTMGCVGPKCEIKVRGDMNFMDVVVLQLQKLNETYDMNIPLVLMNSFNTDKKTRKLIRGYPGTKMFSQSKFPRIAVSDLMPIDKEQFYPPGHGNLFYSINKSGMLDELLAEGKEYLFVSNIDNLAATVDLQILQYFAEENLEFCMEVTEKTRADVKGGTLVNINGALTLLEIAQVPADKKSEFTSTRKFRVFNTNSAWINLKALKELLGSKQLDFDIICNKKMVGGEMVIQLETALGVAVRFFKNNCGVVVPRSRFMPVKTCSDLFLLESSLFIEQDGTLIINPERTSPNQPIVKLVGENFKAVHTFEEAFAGIPDIVDLDILTVSGNVKFGKNVTLRGIVIICAAEGGQIDIPEGAVLEDKILMGSLATTDL